MQSLDASDRRTLTASRRPTENGDASENVRAGLIRELVALSDAALILLAGALAAELFPGPLDSPLQILLGFAGHALIVCTISVWLMRSAGHYELDRLTKWGSAILSMTGWLLAAYLIYVGLVYAIDSSAKANAARVIAWLAMAWLLLVAGRGVAALVIRMLSADGWLRERIALYGSSDLCASVVQAISVSRPDASIVGIFADPERGLPSFPVNGNIRDLISAVRNCSVDRIIVVLPASSASHLAEVVSDLSALPIRIQLCPDGMTLPFPVKGVSQLESMLMVDVGSPPLSSRQFLYKNMLDYVISTAALVLLTPLMLVIAAAIKLDSPGPLFFVQSRNGYNGKLIRVIKFRTMLVQEDGPVIRQAVRDDPRVTTVGRFLRRTSLDELPQLFNVLRGELSLVGPRPHAVAHNEAYEPIIPKYAHRYRMKPGITGWAQVNGYRGETREVDQMVQRVRYDIWYLDHWSIWLDIKILLKTLTVPFRHQAY